MSALKRARPQRGVVSGAVFDAWMAGRAAPTTSATARLPGKSFSRNYEHILRRLHRALEIRYSTVEWWRHDLWDPKHDRRIPLGEHEALGGARVRFDTVPQPWLREGLKWFLAVGLERGEHKWTSITAYRAQLGTHFSRFLAEEGIDTPALCADPDMELRGWRCATSRSCARRAPAADGRAVLAGHGWRAAGDRRALLRVHGRPSPRGGRDCWASPRWLELSDAHARFWRDSDWPTAGASR